MSATVRSGASAGQLRIPGCLASGTVMCPRSGISDCFLRQCAGVEGQHRFRRTSRPARTAQSTQRGSRARPSLCVGGGLPRGAAHFRHAAVLALRAGQRPGREPRRSGRGYRCCWGRFRAWLHVAVTAPRPRPGGASPCDRITTDESRPARRARRPMRGSGRDATRLGRIEPAPRAISITMPIGCGSWPEGGRTGLPLSPRAVALSIPALRPGR